MVISSLIQTMQIRRVENWRSGLGLAYPHFHEDVSVSVPSFLQKHDEGIAPSLLQGYVVLAIPMVLRATPTPLQTS